MTKLAMCLDCSDIVMPYPDSDVTKEWRHCYCRRCSVAWEDGKLGKLLVGHSRGRNHVRVIGMNNLFLYSDETVNIGDDNDWKQRHAETSAKCGDHYLFHHTRRDCWACIIAVGQTGDVSFVDNIMETKT